MTDAIRQPNVLFIITDQHRADHVGFNGNAVVQTPNLDSIAERGTVFDSCWVSNPVCMPNRSTIVTGRMPSAHGVIGNDRSLDWGANTWIRQFQQAGYRTGLLGKSHLQNGVSRLTLTGFTEPPAVNDPHPAGWNEFEFEELYESGALEWPEDFYGFDTVELSLDHGANVAGHHLLWALERGAKREDLVVPQTAENPKRRGSDAWWQVYEPPYDEEFHSSSFVADRTINFIEEATAQGSPWVAWASFPDPHHPFTPPGQWYDRHSADDMELPATFDDPLEGAPKYLKRFQSRTVHDMRQWVDVIGATSPEVTRAAIAANYGTIEMIDDRVGQIRDAIERLGQTDDTIVIFTSDHGDMLGDHGLILKGLMHYRGTLQVPLVIADPRRNAARTTSLASSIDLGPTLMDLCSVDGYHGIQGHSLAPILDDPAAAVRDHVLVEDDIDINFGGLVPARTRTLVTATHRYTRHSTGEEGLYELGTQDDERTNLAAAETTLRNEMVDRLTGSLLNHSDAARGVYPTAM